MSYLVHSWSILLIILLGIYTLVVCIYVFFFVLYKAELNQLSTPWSGGWTCVLWCSRAVSWPWANQGPDRQVKMSQSNTYSMRLILSMRICQLTYLLGVNCKTKVTSTEQHSFLPLTSLQVIDKLWNLLLYPYLTEGISD